MTTQDKAVRHGLHDRESIIADRKRSLHYQGHPYKPLHEILGNGAWVGQRCFIIGGGPSLDGFDFEALRGQGRVITINLSFLKTPFADILYFMDNRFYRLLYNGKFGSEALKKWQEFQGYRVFLNIMGRKYEDVYSVRSLGRIGLSNSLQSGIYHGNNSGVGAVGLAVCLKANPIYLLGIDCKFINKKTHHHSGYGFPMGEGIVKSFIADFERMNRFIKRTHFKVINLNPQSGLRCFPFSIVSEVLGNGKARKDLGRDGGSVFERDDLHQPSPNQ